MEIVLLSLTFSTLIIACFFMFYALKGYHQFYWLSAITIYLFSFMTSFTVGLFTVSFAFVSLVLAIGYQFRWIKSRVSLVIFLCVGLLVGILMVYYVRDDLFYPF